MHYLPGNSTEAVAQGNSNAVDLAKELAIHALRCEEYAVIADYHTHPPQTPPPVNSLPQFGRSIQQNDYVRNTLAAEHFSRDDFIGAKDSGLFGLYVGTPSGNVRFMRTNYTIIKYVIIYGRQIVPGNFTRIIGSWKTGRFK